MKSLIITLTTIFCFHAFADTNIDFNYEGAVAAFKTGKLPVESEFIGKWSLIGVAAKNGQPDYSANGEFKYTNAEEFYSISREFTRAGTDAFGRALYTSVDMVHHSAGQLSHFVPDSQWTVGSRLRAVTHAQQSPEVVVCGRTDECRLLANGMLLCETQTTGPKICPRDNHFFSGYVRPATASVPTKEN